MQKIHYTTCSLSHYRKVACAMTNPTSVRLDDSLLSQLEALARAMQRPKTWIIEEAIRRYVADQSWQVAAIQQELDAHHRGEGVVQPHERVMDELETRIRNRLSS